MNISRCFVRWNRGRRIKAAAPFYVNEVEDSGDYD